MTDRPPERDDLDALLDPLLGLAQKHLTDHGEFYPFGSVMTTTGQIRLVAGYSGAEHPPSQEVIDLLIDGMKQQAAAGEIRAIGVCFDSRIEGADGKPTDAISVSLEHRAGDTVRVYLPYSKGRFSGLRFGDLAASGGKHLVFLAGDSGDIGGR